MLRVPHQRREAIGTWIKTLVTLAGWRQFGEASLKDVALPGMEVKRYKNEYHLEKAAATLGIQEEKRVLSGALPKREYSEDRKVE